VSNIETLAPDITNINGLMDKLGEKKRLPSEGNERFKSSSVLFFPLELKPVYYEL
jgi:hypothetical protein